MGLFTHSIYFFKSLKVLTFVKIRIKLANPGSGNLAYTPSWACTEMDCSRGSSSNTRVATFRGIKSADWNDQSSYTSNTGIGTENDSVGINVS